MRTAVRISKYLALLAAMSLGAPMSAQQAGGTDNELRVVTSGGFAAAYDLLAPRFEAETGIALVTERGASTGGAPDSIPVRLERGEAFDVVILSRPGRRQPLGGGPHTGRHTPGPSTLDDRRGSPKRRRDPRHRNARSVRSGP